MPLSYLLGCLGWKDETTSNQPLTTTELWQESHIMAAYDPTRNPSSKQFIVRNPGEAVLRDLYEVQRLSTKAIAKQFGVCVPTVCRWLHESKIYVRGPIAQSGPRPSEETLRFVCETQDLSMKEMADHFDVNRNTISNWFRHYGIKTIKRKPHNLKRVSKEELDQAFNVEYLGYRGVAEKFNSNPRTIWRLVKHYGVDTPTFVQTRTKGMFVEPDHAEVKRLYESGIPLHEIGTRFGVDSGTIKRICKEEGVEIRLDGFNGKRQICKNGLLVKSIYEMRVADWLIDHSVEFFYEPRYPFSNQLKADFSANGWFVEIWGIEGHAGYRTRRERKVRLCRIHEVPLIQINYTHFQTRDKHIFESRMSQVLDQVKAPGMLF